MDRTIKRRMLCGLTALAVIAAGIGTPALGNIGPDLDISVSAADIVDSGFCGDPAVNEGKNVTWSLDGEGTLTISGEGAMADHDDEDSPWNDKEVKKVIIGEGVTRIGDCAFFEKTKIAEVSISSTVTEIGYGAFFDCESLTSAVLPSGVKSIQKSAFSSCTALREISIPDTVTMIGESAFDLCPELKTVTIPASVEVIEKDAFGFYLDAFNKEVKKTEGFKILCYKYTDGYRYAADNGFEYELLDKNAVKITPKYTLKDGETAPDLTKLAITVFDSTGTIAAEVKTDKNGRAELGDLAEDKYTLKIELDGFAPRSMEYTLGSDPGETAVCKYGDCDGDGKIGFGDLGLMQQKLCDWDVEYVYSETADTDGDGKNSLNDLGTLQQYLCDWNIKLGKSDSFDDSVELPIIPV